MSRCGACRCFRFRVWASVGLASLLFFGRRPCMAVVTLESEFGSRWPRLSEALGKPKRYAAWVNPFAAKGAAQEVLSSHRLEPLTGIAGEAHLWAPSEIAEQQLLPKPPNLFCNWLEDLLSAGFGLSHACVGSTASLLLHAQCNAGCMCGTRW